ncbi:MAG TPA: NB-ARC domain-containing protein [Thermoflexales bacterium]|nr:NB-ARC domain-containing protein [Thermoflexales bacterium]
MTKPPRYPCGHTLIAPLLRETARQQGVTHKTLESALAARLGIARATVRAWGTGYARPQSDAQARAVLALARDANWTPSQKAGLLDCIEARPSLREELLAEAVARSRPLSPMIPVVTANRVHGREALLERICARLGAGETVGLSGMGGIGKSTLAALVTATPAMRARFHDGVLWASLGPSPDLFFEAGQWISALIPEQVDLASLPTFPVRQARLRELLASRNILIVIDDAWAAGHVVELILGGSNCAHLVTTRDAALAATLCAPEACLRVPDLDAPDSARLLTALAPGLARHPKTQLARLVQHAGGLPLALNIFGRLAWRAENADPEYGVEVLLEALASATRRVQAPIPVHANTRPRHLLDQSQISIGLSLSTTWERLSLPARQALSDLTLFPPKGNTFSEQAALATLAESEGALRELISAGLIETHAGGRLAIHQSIHDFAAQQAPSDAAARRWIQYWQAFLREHQMDFVAQAAEHENAEAALGIARQRAAAEFPNLACLRYLYRKDAGLLPVAERQLEEALEVARAHGDAWSEARVLLNLGNIARNARNDLAGAERRVRRALELIRTTSDTDMRANIASALCIILLYEDRPADAWIVIEEALGLLEQLTPAMRSEVLQDAAIARRTLGAIDEAIGLFKQAIATAREAGVRYLEAQSLGYLAATEMVRNDLEAALAYAREAVALARAYALPSQLTFSLSALGLVLMRLGKTAEADAAFAEVMTLVARVSSPPVRIDAALAMAEWRMAASDVEAARRHLAEARAMIDRGGFASYRARLEAGQRAAGL